MIIESGKVEQYPNEDRRRWFFDADFDLILWQKGEEWTTFQLCYNKRNDEHAVIWRQESGFDHYRVDGGEPGPLKNLSPVLVNDGSLEAGRLRQSFARHSRDIDPKVREFVLAKLDELAQDRALRLLGEPRMGGVYLLWMRLNQAKEVVFGRYGQGKPVALNPGWYVYVGSAHGERGANTLANRLLRHATRSGGKRPHAIRGRLGKQLSEGGLGGKLPKGKSPHWHVDYLLDLEEAELKSVLVIPTQDRIEKRLAEWLVDQPEVSEFAPGLGASDHPGGTHLVHITTTYTWWEKLPNRVERFLTQNDNL